MPRWEIKTKIGRARRQVQETHLTIQEVRCEVTRQEPTNLLEKYKLIERG